MITYASQLGGRVNYSFVRLEERVVGLLRDLIAIDSVSGREEGVQRFIEGRLRAVGLEVKRQPVEGSRFNLLYHGRGSFLISCHVDTVPPGTMKYPFVPREMDGRIYGRGASDVKGALASLLAAVEVFRERYPQDELPVSLAFVVDEENNSALGSMRAREAFPNCEFCLVLEPTYGILCTSQSGSLELSVRVEGEGAHASEFEKTENPVRVFMRLVEALEEKLLRPVNVIYVKGGSKNYLVPKVCNALLEVKVFKGESWREVEERVREVIKELGTSCKVSYRREDAEDFIDFRESEMIRLLKEVFWDSTGEEPKEGTMPSWTDAANYHKAGLSCVVFGYGSLKDSHTERESISLEELSKMSTFLLRLLERLR